MIQNCGCLVPGLKFRPFSAHSQVVWKMSVYNKDMMLFWNDSCKQGIEME
jgi:hypothetical protein